MRCHLVASISQQGHAHARRCMYGWMCARFYLVSFTFISELMQTRGWGRGWAASSGSVLAETIRESGVNDWEWRSRITEGRGQRAVPGADGEQPNVRDSLLFVLLWRRVSDSFCVFGQEKKKKKSIAAIEHQPETQIDSSRRCRKSVPGKGCAKLWRNSFGTKVSSFLKRNKIPRKREHRAQSYAARRVK